MPKRLHKYYMENVARCRRKSMLIDDLSQLSSNLDDEEEKDEADKKPMKEMKFMRSSQNEIERLLLHNSKNLMYHVDHSDFPAFNVGLWPQESSDTLTNYPTCAFSVPRPIFVANKACAKIDLCYKRPMNREFHIKRLKHTRTSYQTALKNKAIRSSAKDGFYHTSVFDMAERLFLEPDPYFHSSYDFYFTGGNLCVLPHNGNIVHVGGEQLQNVVVSEFRGIQDCTAMGSLFNVAFRKSPESCEIFEVSPLLTSLDCSRQNCFITRQRNLISLNFPNENNEIKTVTQFRNKLTPFISFAQSKRDIGTFIITTMKQHVRLYDLNSNSPSLTKLFEISPKTPNISWNTVKPWREHTFLYANEKEFFSIDTRTSPEQWMNKVTFAKDSSVCDHISGLLPSDFNNLFYVATNHKLHCMDIRHLKTFSFSDTEGAICRWSHLLRYAPLMMDSFRLLQTEYVALSSPIAGDLHICQLSRQRNEDEISIETSVPVPKHVYNSLCLPYQPPTLFEAYENARLSGKCLKPEANLEARIKCCTTGLTFHSLLSNNLESEIGLLLTSNSNGDVFAHTLSKREKKEKEVRCDRHSDEIMDELEKKICSQTQPPLYYTEIKNMIGMRKVFLGNILSSVKKYDFDAMDNEYNEDDAKNNANSTNVLNTNHPSSNVRPRRLYLGRWQKSLSTLHSYKDALAADLLSIWDIDLEEENNIRLGDLKAGSHVKPDPSAKVKDWLDTNIIPNPPMVSIPVLETSKRGNTSYSSDNIFNISQTQNTAIFENVAHSTHLMDNSVNISTYLETSGLELPTQNDTTTVVDESPKNKKRSKKYVKGF